MEFFGLKESDILSLRKKYGKNLILGKEKIGWFSIFLSQFKNPLIYILVFVGLISLIFDEYFDFLLVVIVVILNVLMGFFQEYNAKKILFSLRNILKPQALVIREGKRKIVNGEDLVPGDVVVLISGDKIPADGELIQGEVFVNEAILTGEEEEVFKKIDEDKNLFMGSIIVSGKGIMKVTKIGLETEIGKIGKSLTEIKEEKTTLQEKLEVLSKRLALIIMITCALIFVFGILQERDVFETFRIAVVLAVAAIPEALPVAVTVILALGMRRILKRKGLIKTLLAVETLGSTSVICTDKTGTLTEGKMKVVKSYFLNEEKSILNMILNNEERTSLELAISQFGKDNLEKETKEKIETATEIYEEPFDSEKKYSLSLQKIREREISFLKGAPEILLRFCKNDKEEKNKILEIINEWAQEGLRVLGLAFKEEGNLKEKESFIFSGVLGISDPLREKAKEVLKFVQDAGVKIKIVTGDYRKTAERVAKNLGFEINSENILEGGELEKISLGELKEKIDKINVFVRVLPHQKRKIVDVFQQKGEVVAMTGDGVNDAPALKEANIGIAVGEATEVAKEAADLVLLDSNFKTIVSAIEEGRLVLANIKKTVAYALSNSFLEIAVIFVAGLFGYPPPLTIAQILYLHFLCDGPQDLALAFEPKEKELMKQKPTNVQKEPILDRRILFFILTITFFVLPVALFIYWYFGIKSGNINLGRTLVFAIFGSIDLIYVFAFKNLKTPIIKTETFFKNKFLLFAIFGSFLLLFLAIYSPLLNKILTTIPLNWWQWLMVLIVGIITTLLLELIKILTKK